MKFITKLKNLLTPEILIVIFSWVAVVGSLYIGFFGDPIANLKDMTFFDPTRAIPPCELCWYQRMFIYPIAIISTIGLYLKEKRIAYYILPFSILTIIIASYHVYIQETGMGVVPCGLGRPCNIKEFEYLGFITIPVMSLITVIIISFLSVLSLRKLRNSTL